jgi:hypothetical protein
MDYQNPSEPLDYLLMPGECEIGLGSMGHSESSLVLVHGSIGGLFVDIAR